MSLEEEVGAKFISSRQEMMVNVRYTANLIASAQNVFMHQYGITMAQFNILRILRGAKTPITIQTIKSKMIEKSPNTTRLIDKLLEKGLVVKNQSIDDRRNFFIGITKKGSSVLAEIDAIFIGSILVPDIMEEEEVQQLNSLLDKLRSAFRSQII